MRRFELRSEKIWRLRRRLTECRKAIKGARGGLTRLMIEALEHDIGLIRDELKNRKRTPIRASRDQRL